MTSTRVVAMFLVLAGPLAACGADAPAAAPTVTVTAAPTSIAPAKAEVSVPDVTGLAGVSEAGRALQDAGLVVGKVTELEATEPPFGITQQSPHAGSIAVAGTAIDLTVVQLPGSDPLTTVPTVTGLGEPAAQHALEAAGFKVVVRSENNTDIRPGDVVTQSPRGGSVVEVGATVTIWTAHVG